MAATKVLLNLVMVPGKIEGEKTLLRHEDQSPIQTGSAFVNASAKFADGNSRVSVWIPKAVLHQSQSG